MTHQELARDLLAAFCVLQGGGTIALDMNRSHASNPLWLRHARFHVVWQTATVAALAVVEIVILFYGNSLPSERFYMVVALAFLPVAGFFVAFCTRGAYGGALSDENGIPPLKIPYRGSIVRIDLNLGAEAVAILVIATLVWIYHD